VETQLNGSVRDKFNATNIVCEGAKYNLLEEKKGNCCLRQRFLPDSDENDP